MKAYGAVAPGALRATGATAQREGKSNASTFMALVAGVLVIGTCCVFAFSCLRFPDCSSGRLQFRRMSATELAAGAVLPCSIRPSALVCV